MKKVMQIVLVLMVLICIYGYAKSETTISLAQEPNKYESNKLDTWMGRYGFTDTFEHNSGEINYFVDYEIIIYKDDGKYYAELEGNGWFLQTRSLAYVEGDENSIDIIFKSSLPGDSLYGIVERYEEDELMLTLSYDDSELISSWHVLRKEHPIFTESEEEIKDIYFEKLDESITLPSALPSYRKMEINSEDLDTWLGAYSYSELYKFDDENVDVNFELIIYKVDGNYYAEFKNNGYSLRAQDYSVLLQSRSLAYIKGNEESIDIYFKKTLPGDSLCGISERYKSNELLLTLTYSDSGLQSTWHALQEEKPVLGESDEKMEGNYFKEMYNRTAK
ncbi:MAG: hypothetical protein HDR12_07480 [Lachnospiraceae bacterium]|nr:hypothetical protein [Lachnospiraceae bacterium]